LHRILAMFMCNVSICGVAKPQREKKEKGMGPKRLLININTAAEYVYSIIKTIMDALHTTLRAPQTNEGMPCPKCGSTSSVPVEMRYSHEFDFVSQFVSCTTCKYSWFFNRKRTRPIWTMSFSKASNPQQEG